METRPDSTTATKTAALREKSSSLRANHRVCFGLRDAVEMIGATAFSNLDSVTGRKSWSC